MRFYDVAVTSLAIGAPPKWTDNLLSQFPIPDVQLERRGVARRVSHSAVVRLALIRELHTELGLSVRDAVRRADELLESHAGTATAGETLVLTVDFAAVERRVDARLREALESAPAPRRGRPPRRS